MPVLLLLGLAAAGWLLLSKGGGGGAALDNSSDREDVPEMQLDPYGTSEDGDLVELLPSIGWLYYAGRGSPSTPWADGPKGVDCSGYACMVLVLLGILPSSSPDRRATADYNGVLSLANICDPVAVGDQQPGDLAIYPGHVMVVYGRPRAGGHSPVIGASGGTSATKGDKASARVKLFDSGDYRRDFITYGRLKPEYRR